jgi:Na+/H+-dicarboxylate symporter
MAVGASIGSPVTPGAGIPAAGIALILGVDRILDMCRTSVNELGDVVVCITVQYLTRNLPATNNEIMQLKQQ